MMDALDLRESAYHEAGHAEAVAETLNDRRSLRGDGRRG
jgi:hypothetical protein